MICLETLQRFRYNQDDLIDSDDDDDDGDNDQDREDWNRSLDHHIHHHHHPQQQRHREHRQNKIIVKQKNQRTLNRIKTDDDGRRDYDHHYHRENLKTKSIKKFSDYQGDGVCDDRCDSDRCCHNLHQVFVPLLMFRFESSWLNRIVKMRLKDENSTSIKVEVSIFLIILF